METGLEGKPWYFGAAIGLGVSVALVIGGYKMQFEKMKNETLRHEKKLSDLQRKISDARAAERRLPQFREEIRVLELELDKLLRILPTRRKTEDMLRKIRALTEQGDFDLLLFSPEAPVQRDDFYSEWAIKIQLQGTYHNLALFFDRISRFPRIINIENLRIKPTRGEGRHSVGASFTAKTFLYGGSDEQ